MRGEDRRQSALFSYLSPEDRVPQDHPLRIIRELMDRVLVELSPGFDELYAKVGRPSIPPEQLLRALVLQALYSVRSERLLMEELNYNLLFRWFVGLNADDPVWVPTVFSKNRERLLEGEVARGFLDAVVEEARRLGLLSDEHFTVDGTLLEAWASQKSFRPKARARGERPRDDDPGNPSVDFRGERRSNATHASTTDPDARLARKGPGKEAKLCYMGHALMDNRHGLAVGARVSRATGTAEGEAALKLLDTLPPRRRRRTVGADKAYDVAEFVRAVRARGFTLHVAQNTSRRRSNVDRRTTRHTGYAVSQKRRHRIEETYGWCKVIGLLRKLRHRGLARVDWVFTFALATYNLVRLKNLIAAGVAP